MTEQDTRITRRATLGIGASLIAGYGLRAQPAGIIAAPGRYFKRSSFFDSSVCHCPSTRPCIGWNWIL